jgi:HSP20 family protein
MARPQEGNRPSEQELVGREETKAGAATAETGGPIPGAAEVDAVIRRMEVLYQAVTGQPPPPPEANYAPIPVERDPVRFVEEQLERLISSLDAARAGGLAPQWTPPLTVWEGNEEVSLCLELPGVRREDVKVWNDESGLVVAGKLAPAREGQRLRSTERPLGNFVRHIPLPPDLRGGGEPAAELRDGVLELRLRRAPGSTQGRKAVEVR